MINDKLNIIDWRFICKCSSNKNVLELLKFNRDKIDWNELSGNENAIELLKERIECEKNLNKDEYKKLSKITDEYVVDATKFLTIENYVTHHLQEVCEEEEKFSIILFCSIKVLTNPHPLCNRPV